MRIARVKPERWHNYDEGDAMMSKKHLYKGYKFFKKGFWKRYDRKRWIKKQLGTLAE